MEKFISSLMKNRFSSVIPLLAIFLFSGVVQALPAPPGVRLLSCDRKGAVIEFQLPEYQVNNVNFGNETFKELRMPGWGHITVEGKPAMPMGTVLLAVPPGAQVSLSLEKVESHSVAMDKILPVSQWQTDVWNKNHTEVYETDGSVYNSTAPYPQEWAVLGKSAWLRMYNVVPIRITPMRAVPGRGEVLIADKLRLRVTFHGGRQGKMMRDPHGEAMAKESILNQPLAVSWQEKHSTSPPSPDVSYGQYKLLVDEDGIYSITYTDLQSADINPNDVDPATIKIKEYSLELDTLVEIPIWVDSDFFGFFDYDDRVLFYGKFARGDFTWENVYTRSNVYWMDWGGGPGLRMTEVDVTPSPGGVTASYYQAIMHTELDTIYQSFGEVTSGEFVDHWMWYYLDDDIAGHTSLTYFPSLPGIVTTTGNDFHLTASFRGYTMIPGHNVTVTWNGGPVINATWDNQNAVEVTGAVSPGYYGSGVNAIVFTPTQLTTIPNGVYLDWIEIEYMRNYSVQNDTLLFQKQYNSAPGTFRFQLTGLSNPASAELWDITSYERLINFTAPQDSLIFKDYAGNDTYYFVSCPSRFLTPVFVKDEPTNWMSTGHGADYIIITHEDFYDALDPLVEHYENSMRVLRVNIGDLYDEWSYGLKDPDAIQEFIQYAWVNYADPPVQYVLLVGDASWDYKNYDPLPHVDYVPTHSYMTWKWGETSSDNWFVLVSGEKPDPLPDCYIGRFPVNSVEETAIMVEKSVTYAENPPEGYWRSQVVFTNGANEISDAIIFDNAVDSLLANYFPEWYDPPRVYYFPSPGNEQYLGDSTKLVEIINQGAALVNYIGHAGNQLWYTMSLNNVNQLTNGDKLPFVASFSCFTGVFTNTKGLGETFVLHPDGGAVAYWSNGAIGYTITNNDINNFLFNSLFDPDTLFITYPAPYSYVDTIIVDDPPTFGLATFAAKHQFWDYYIPYQWNQRDVVQTFTLLGDPGLTFIYEEPDSTSLLDLSPPEISFIIPGSPNFHDGDFLQNPVKFSCEITDSTLIELSSLEMEFHHVSDSEGSIVDTSWQWSWDQSSSVPAGFIFDPNPPDPIEKELKITFNEAQFPGSLNGGRWEFVMTAMDYYHHSTADSLIFRIASILEMDTPLNYPNPFREKTDVTFNLSQNAQVTIKIYTVSGKLVRTLPLPSSAGYNIHEYDGCDQQGDPLSNGTYIYKVIATNGSQQVEKIGKMVRIR